VAESIGKRIAYLRQKHGWTQQSLANRLAMSRVAISHIEMDLTIPSERSITLMAGLFKLTPPQLVEGTTYPRAKAERLPELTTILTEPEHDLALLENDLEWLNSLERGSSKHSRTRQVLEKWSPKLEEWNCKFQDAHEAEILAKMRLLLQKLQELLNHPPA